MSGQRLRPGFTPRSIDCRPLGADPNRGVNPGRVGVTLIELLVVVAIIALLLALTAIFFPSFQRREGVASGADSTAGALLATKMRAKRDGRPTGLRLAVNNPPGGTALNANQYNQFLVIQQPDDFAQGRYTGPSPSSNTTATFTGVTFTGNVSPGDYLELNGGGLLYQILPASASLPSGGVGTNTLMVSDIFAAHPLPTATSDVGTSAGTNYRIIRAPQVLTNEPPVNLPTGVIIDGGTSPFSQQSPFASGNGDILFAPSGALVGAGVNTPVFLVLRQADGVNLAPYSNDLTSYYATIIAVEPRTGFIASHPVSPSSSDPFAFTRDGQASGM